MNNSTLHAAIFSSFLDAQRAPTVAEIAARFGCDESTARRGLQELAEYHGVVLHPHSDSIWVAHPFSAAPTTCVVHAGTKRWWGNCAWCSLGVVHLAGGTATIETRLGAIGDPVSIRIENGTLLDTNYVVHFPVPMRNAWDNVIYTCSVMSIFETDAQVDAWCASRGIPKGDVRPLQQIWHFAQDWYGHHVSPTWTKWTVPEASELFRRHQLTGPIWDLEDRMERF
jgi:hypothetical protein